MIRNLEAALQPLKNLQKNAKQATRQAERTVANRIAQDAASAAPGSLANKISVQQTEESTTVIGGDELSAYVEFGTGLNAAAFLAGKPEEQVQEAAKFFVSGKGTTKSHAFFFPAIYANRDDIIPEVEKELEKIAQ